MDIPSEALDPENWSSFLTPAEQKEIDGGLQEGTVNGKTPNGEDALSKHDGDDCNSNLDSGEVTVKHTPENDSALSLQTASLLPPTKSLSPEKRKAINATWPHSVSAEGHDGPKFYSFQITENGQNQQLYRTASNDGTDDSMRAQLFGTGPQAQSQYNSPALGMPKNPLGTPQHMHHRSWDTTPRIYKYSSSVPCQGSGIGCTWMGYRENVLEHESNCVLAKVSAHLYKLEQTNLALRHQLEELQASVADSDDWAIQFRTLRLRQEVKDCNLHPLPADFKISPSPDLLTWHCHIPGKKGSIHEGATYPVTLEFGMMGKEGNSRLFPFAPPRVRFPVFFFHPNVHPNGEVNLAFLTEESLWDPSMSVKELLLSLQEFLGRIDFTRVVQKVNEEGDEPAAQSTDKNTPVSLMKRLKQQAQKYTETQKIVLRRRASQPEANKTGNQQTQQTVQVVRKTVAVHRRPNSRGSSLTRREASQLGTQLSKDKIDHDREGSDVESSKTATPHVAQVTVETRSLSWEKAAVRIDSPSPTKDDPESLLSPRRKAARMDEYRVFTVGTAFMTTDFE
eukprot:g23960.t1